MERTILDNSIGIVAVLMTVHNRRKTTVECLYRLYKNQLNNFDFCVYLVDDGSTDGTADAVKQSFPDVRIIAGNGELYWNRGMLLAWKEAAKDSPDFYLWLNDDTFLYADALSTMLRGYKECETDMAIICGSTHAVGNVNIVTYGGRYHKRLLIPNGKLQIAEWVNGNCLLVPRKVVEQIGMLDSYFRHAKGDWEYGIRAKKKGVSLFVASKYVGECDSHPHKTLPCYDPSIPLNERLKYLSHPLAPIPSETFYYCRKCLSFGSIRAIVYIFRTYCKTLFPYIFK